MVRAQPTRTREKCTCSADVERLRQLQKFAALCIHSPDKHGDLQPDARRTPTLCGVKAHAFSLANGPGHESPAGTVELVRRSRLQIECHTPLARYTLVTRSF